MYDMAGLKLSHLNRMKVSIIFPFSPERTFFYPVKENEPQSIPALTHFSPELPQFPFQMQKAVAHVDDLNYPEASQVYFVVNAPPIFSTCWRAIKPLLPERTRRKIKVLKGNGRKELLEVKKVL